MTVSTLNNEVTYTGNGSTTQFAVPFKVLDVDHLVVKRLVAATGVVDHTYIGTDYSYSGIGADAGTLTLSGTALGSTYKLHIERVVPYTQDLDLINTGGFYPETVETQLDLMVMQTQQIATEADDVSTRALMVPVGETAPSVASLASAEGKVLAIIGGQVTAIANSTAAVASDVLAVHNDRVASDADAVVAAAALAAVSPYSLANVLRDLAVLKDNLRQNVPVLTTASLVYHAIYATSLVVPTYTGPLFRVIRNSDSAAVDVYPEGKTVPRGIIALLRGTASEVGLRIDKWYDQSGNGRDMTQTTAARRPCLHEDAYWDGSPVILFDGGVNYIGGPDRAVTAQVGFDFTHNLTTRQCAWMAVTDFKESTAQQILFAYFGSIGGQAFYHNGTVNTAIVSDGTVGIGKFKNKNFRAGMAAYIFREKAGSTDLFVDGVATGAVLTSDGVTPASQPTVETLTTGRLGYTPSAGYENYQPNFRMTMFVVLSGAAANDTDCINLTRMAQSNTLSPSRYDSRVIFDGDSIIAGGANKLTLDQFWYLRQQRLNGLPEFFNLGIPSKTLISSYNDRLMFDDVLYKTGDPVIYFLQGGSNDLNNSVSATTLYNSTVANYITYLRSLGSNVKVVVCTILKRTDYSPAKETQRLAYNVLVRANSLGADAVCDPDAALDPTLAGSYASNVLILGGTPAGIHPTSYGYSLLAPEYARVFNLVRPAVLL